MKRVRRFAVAAAAILAAVGLLDAFPAAAQPELLTSLNLESSAFYTLPEKDLAGEPGDVIKSRKIAFPLFPTASVRQIMYQSTDVDGNPVPVTGALLVPLAPSDGPRPLIVITPYTRGLGDHCAPSRFFDPATADPRAIEGEALTYYNYLARGFALVITDYEGGGTSLQQSYLVGPPEGYAGLDALRAAQRLDPGDELTEASPVSISGYSQGGQAASWAAELQPVYAPELRVKGVLAGGVPYDMEAQINHFNGNPTAGAGVGLAALVGLDTAFPKLDLDSSITPGGRAVIERVKNSCVTEVLATFGSISIDDVTEPDALQRPDVQEALAYSQLGRAAPGAPAYIYYGSADTIVPPRFNRQLYRDWCHLGADVQIEQIPGVEHVGGLVLGPVRGIEWLSERLNGAQAPSGCIEISGGCCGGGRHDTLDAGDALFGWPGRVR